MELFSRIAPTRIPTPTTPAVRPGSLHAVLAGALAMALTAAALAGPLTPAAGPVAGTMKTLSEVEPRIALSQQNTPGDSSNVFIINAPGSYYLTGMTGIGSGKNGIRINASHVTIDLNGFTLYGLPGSLDGITTANVFRTTISIRNGTIRTFGGDGVDLDTINTTAPQAVAFERLQVSDNGGFGVQANDGIATDSQFNNNVVTGLSLDAFFPTVVRGCTADGNGGDGFFARYATITNCSARGNGSEGFNISTGTVSNSVAIENARGFFVNPGTISGCTASDNTIGIQASGLVKDNVIERSTATPGTVGIVINAARTRVEGNIISRHALGVQSNSSNCLIIGNSFTGITTTMNVVAGNGVGAILTTSFSGAINGNSGGGVGTTDPYANIIH